MSHAQIELIQDFKFYVVDLMLLVYEKIEKENP